MRVKAEINYVTTLGWKYWHATVKVTQQNPMKNSLGHAVRIADLIDVIHFLFEFLLIDGLNYPPNKKDPQKSGLSFHKFMLETEPSVDLIFSDFEKDYFSLWRVPVINLLPSETLLERIHNTYPEIGHL